MLTNCMDYVIIILLKGEIKMRYTMTFDVDIDENDVKEFVRTLELELAKMEMADEPVNFSVSAIKYKYEEIQ